MPPIIDRAAIHSVQVAEVVKKAVDAGADEEQVRGWIEGLDLDVIEDLTRLQAYNTARFCPNALHLSLGDRVCLTVASWQQLTAVTTERNWHTVTDADTQLNVKVLLVRDLTGASGLLRARR